MRSSFPLDGGTVRFQFDWPYLDRSNIMVTSGVNVPRAFKWISDHEIEVKSLFGEPLTAEDSPLVIQRVTPDLESSVYIQDASQLTADNLNRMRRQLLYLIQERSGGLTGSVGTAIQVVTNEINTVSGALDNIETSMAQLENGLQTLDSLSSGLTVVENEAATLRQNLLTEIAERSAETSDLQARVTATEAAQGSLQAQVTTEIAALAAADSAQALRVDQVEAKVQALGEDDTPEQDQVGASIIQTALAQVRSGRALALQIESIQAQVGDNLMAEVETRISALASEVDGVQAQWTLKATAVRGDGSPVIAGIGVAATATDQMSRSEIVMQADRLLFVDGTNVDGTVKPIMAAGLVDGSPTLVIPANNMGDRTYPGRVIVDGSIEGRSVAADTITGDKLTAGSITTREINVGLGTNLVPNASFAASSSYWTTVDGPGAETFAHNLSGPAWCPVGGNALGIYQPDATSAGSSHETTYSAWRSTEVPVNAGARYEFSVYTGAIKATAYAALVFLDAAGAVLSTTLSDLNADQASGGNRLTDFKRVVGFATAPANAATARLELRKGATMSGQANSYGYFTQPLLAQANPNQTSPSPWSPSGLGTKVTPEGISTPSLSAITGTIGTLRTATSGGRTEISDNVIKVFDQNNVLRVKLGNLSL